MVPSAPPKPLLKSMASSRPRKSAIRRSSSRCRSVMPERTGAPQAPKPWVKESLLSGGYDLGVIGQAEVIVGTEIDDGVWLALVLECGPGVGAPEHLRLIKLSRSAAGPNPLRKSGGCLKRVVAFPRR